MKTVRAVLVIALGTVLASVCNFATVHVFARRFNDLDCASYMIAMAYIAIIYPLISLGLPGAVLFHVGRNADRRVFITALFLAATGIAVLAAGLSLAGAAIASDVCGRLVFGDPNRSALAVAAVALLCSRVLHDVSCRYLMGSRKWITGTSLYVVGVGLIPLLVVLVGRPLRVTWLIAETALATYCLVGCYLTLFWIGAGRNVARPTLVSARSNAHRLLRYGVPRILGILCTVFLFSAPVLLAERLHVPSVQVVLIAGAMGMLRLINVAGGVLTNVIVPKTSWLDLNRQSALRGRMGTLVACAVGLAIVASALYVGAGNSILQWWVCRPVGELSGFVFVVWLSAAPLTLVAVLRPVIDALAVRAYNTRNVVVAVAVMGIAMWVGMNVATATSALAVAMAAASTVLAALTMWTLRDQLRLRSVAVPGASAL